MSYVWVCAMLFRWQVLTIFMFVVLVACDNDILTEERALNVFGTEPYGGPTWRDSETDLVWERNPGDLMTWDVAAKYCLENWSELPGTGWRLPDISELRLLVRGCAAVELPDGDCNIAVDGCLSWDCRDPVCMGCTQDAGPARGCYWDVDLQGDCGWYWSSSECEGFSQAAWGVSFRRGGVFEDSFSMKLVRCVR